MFKTVIACAALALVSAQDVNSLANQIAAASEAVTVANNDVSLVVDNYEWSLTEQGNEYNLAVNELAENANNLAATLSALLANVGEVVLANDNGVEGVDVAEAVEQLNQNNNAIVEAAQNGYNQGVTALATNQDGALSAANGQLNQGSVSEAVNQGVEAAVANAPAAVNLASENAGALPVEANPSQLINSAQNAALNQVGNADANTAADQAQGAANQALAAGQEAADANLPSGLANAANTAANTLAANAGDAANTAASSLNNVGASNVNNAADVARNNAQ